MQEDLFKLDTKQGEEELLNIQEILEKEPEAATLLREEIKARIIYVMQESKEMSQIMIKLLREITQSSGIPLREICDTLIGADDDDDEDDFAEYRDEEFDDEEEQDVEPQDDKDAIDSDQPMPTQKIAGPLLPPDKIGPRPNYHFSYGIPSSWNDQPRVAKLKEILNELGILEKDCMRYEEEEEEEEEEGEDNEDKNVDEKNKKKRKNPYEIIAIPALEKIILICDKAGNATYIVRAKPEEAEKYSRMKKSELRVDPQVDFLPWKHVRDWKDDLKNLLVSRSPRAYFRAENAERIRNELMAFAAKVGGGIDVKDLPLWIFPSTTIVDQDGETRRGDDYVEQAAIELGIVKNKLRVPRYDVLRKLLELAGLK